MKQTRLIMGMPVVIEVVDSQVTDLDLIEVFDYFREVDQRFSTYKPESEISAINAGVITPAEFSREMKHILEISEQTREETNGYFNIAREGKIDPSGIVKGWAIRNAAGILRSKGFANYYVDAGGDVEVSGKDTSGNPWTVGIRNPFKHDEHIKILSLSNAGVATSGTSVRGQHIYNPVEKNAKLDEVVSITVIGPDVYEADRFATAAFAMQGQGIYFIESRPGLEAYMIDRHGIASFTSNFNDYVAK